MLNFTTTAKTKDNNFVLTAFRDRNNKDLATDKFVRSSSFTDKDGEFNAKDKPALLSNQTQPIIPQTTPKTKDEIIQAVNKRKAQISKKYAFSYGLLQKREIYSVIHKIYFDIIAKN